MDPTSGGPCQGIRQSIPALSELGCDNEVLCLDPPGETFGVCDPFVVHRIGRGRGPWKYHRGLVPWLIEHLPGYDAVIIHGLWLHHSFAMTRAVGWLRRHAGAGGLRSVSGEADAVGGGAGAKPAASALPLTGCSFGGVRVPRVFVMPHGMLDPWFQREPSRRLKAIRNWMVWKVAEHRVISQADGVLFTCQRELELAREPFRPYRPRRELNVGYGVAPPPAATPSMRQAFDAAVPELGGRPYLLFLSRIHPKKGVDLLLRAYGELRTQRCSPSPPAPLPEAGRGEPDSYAHPHSPAPLPEAGRGEPDSYGRPHSTAALPEAGRGEPDRSVGSLPALVIAGPLDSEYARQMRSLARQPGTPDVFFAGMLSGEAKWGALHGCDAFVLPSHQENFGIAVVEAMACGRPVLISDQVNICREIVDAGAGLVRPDTAAGTTALLRDFAETSAGDHDKMASAAKACYAAHFQIEQAAARMLRAITAISH